MRSALRICASSRFMPSTSWRPSRRPCSPWRRRSSGTVARSPSSRPNTPRAIAGGGGGWGCGACAREVTPWTGWCHFRMPPVLRDLFDVTLPMPLITSTYNAYRAFCKHSSVSLRRTALAMRVITPNQQCERLSGVRRVQIGPEPTAPPSLASVCVPAMSAKMNPPVGSRRRLGGSLPPSPARGRPQRRRPARGPNPVPESGAHAFILCPFRRLHRRLRSPMWQIR